MSSFESNLKSNNIIKNIYTQIASKTVANTVSETSLINNSGCLGTLDIPANFLKVGTVLHYRCRGKVSTTSTPSTTMKFKLNSTELITSTITMATVSNIYIDADVYILCKTIGSSGSVLLYGRTTFVGGTGPSAVTSRPLQGTDVTINTTILQNLDHTYTWGTASASNTVTIYHVTLDANMVT